MDDMDEKELSCYLKSKKNVNYFASTILYYLIKNAIGFGETSSNIVNIMIEVYENTNELVKPGLSKSMSKKVVQLVKNGDRKSYDKLMAGEKNFHRIMGAMYGFLDGRVNKKIYDFVLYLVERNKKIKSLVMRRLKKAFCLPNDVDWEDIKRFVGENVKNKKIYYDMLIHVTNCPESIMRRNLSRVEYIREGNKDEDRKDKHTNNMLINPKSDKTNCHRDITRNRDAFLVTSKYHYKLDNTFFQNLMNDYNYPSIGGPSGSVIILYDFVFSLLGVKPSKENKLLLLAIAIADYVPYYHSLVEILLSYSIELDLGYTIDKNPVDFVVHLLQKYRI